MPFFVTATADIEADLLLRLASNRCLWGKQAYLSFLEVRHVSMVTSLS